MIAMTTSSSTRVNARCIKMGFRMAETILLERGWEGQRKVFARTQTETATRILAGQCVVKIQLLK